MSARTSSGALANMVRMIGAPHICVTLAVAMACAIAAGSARRRQTCVPPNAVIVHGKHQPLQWNMGNVHRYTGAPASPHATMLPIALR